LLNNVPKVILAYVVDLRLRLLPIGIVSKIGLVQRTLLYVLAYLVHTQMITLPVFRVIHCFFKKKKINPSLLQETQYQFYDITTESNHERPQNNTHNSKIYA
jgi:hypothetical protein